MMDDKPMTATATEAEDLEHLLQLIEDTQREIRELCGIPQIAAMPDDHPPPRYGTRKNPTTGKTETYELPAPPDLAQSRKDLHDMLHGGGWFEDPLSKPAEFPATGQRVRALGMVEDPPGSGVWVFPSA